MGCLFLPSVCLLSSAQAATLAWNASSSPAATGYKIHYGISHGIYTFHEDVHNVTTYTIPANFQSGFFAVSAYNPAGESQNSAEVTYTKPPPSPTPTPPPGSTPPPTPSPRPSPSPTSPPLPGSTPTPTPGSAPIAQRNLANVSTRTFVQSGENVAVGGFIISGATPKKIILRAIGPSLTAAGVTGAMANPMLELYNSAGGLLVSNSSWTTHRQEVVATGMAPTNDNEAAIVSTLPPGAYTAVLRGVNSTSGVALFELYDLDATSSKIANISTRGKVGAGDKVMIGGFIIGGSQPTKVIIRAIGPSLTHSGIAGALANPLLELHNGNGSLIFSNDDWRSSQLQQILATGIQPLDNKESAIIATLMPGNYTAVVRGVGSATGVALVEIYNLEN